MLKEVRKIKSKQKQRYVRNLMERGVLSRHLNEQGYLTYDTDEYERAKAAVRIGRPPKAQTSKEERLRKEVRNDTLIEFYGTLAIEIRDSGKPIDKATLDKIFDKIIEGEEE